MKRNAKVLAGAAALLLAAAGLAMAVVGGDADGRPTATIHATWDFHPTTMAEATARAAQIVLADVVSVRAGEDIVTAAPGEPEGVDRIPTQRITIRVVQSYKGEVRAGQQLTLFQTGGLVSTAKAGDTRPRLVLDGDPFYLAGERYLLMLVPGPQGTVRIVAPEGRYRADARGNLTAMVAGPVADEIRGKRLPDLVPTLTS